MAITKQELYDDIERRIETTQAEMEKEGYDGLIVFANSEMHGSMRYLSDYYPDHGTTMVTADQRTNVTDGAALFMTPEEEPTLLLEPGLVCPREVYTEEIVAGGWDPNSSALTADTLSELMESHGISQGRIGIENYSRFPHFLYEGLESKLPNVDLEQSRIVERLRRTKTDFEIELYEEAGQIAAKVHDIVLEELQDFENKSELDIVYAVEGQLISEEPDYYSKKGPAYLNSGNPIEHARYYHGRGSQMLEAGNTFTWDFPQHYHGYHVDTSRSRVLGGEPTDEQQAGFDAARQVYDEIIEMAKPGVNAMELVNHYHEFMADRGFDVPFGGLLGHGVGLELHERPDMVLDDIELTENMILAIEPRALVGDEVIGLEDMIYVTEDGGERITGGGDRDSLTL